MSFHFACPSFPFPFPKPNQPTNQALMLQLGKKRKRDRWRKRRKERLLTAIPHGPAPLPVDPKGQTKKERKGRRKKKGGTIVHATTPSSLSLSIKSSKALSSCSRNRPRRCRRSCLSDVLVPGHVRALHGRNDFGDDGQIPTNEQEGPRIPMVAAVVGC
mmetsp:Transcript_47973/g.94687  ORF Transcript_47973/g.94687 Transcript_47973/m.94687 type:complete len:159 (-) Transcript_47973:1061-1537(-)